MTLIQDHPVSKKVKEAKAVKVVGGVEKKNVSLTPAPPPAAAAVAVAQRPLPPAERVERVGVQKGKYRS